MIITPAWTRALSVPFGTAPATLTVSTAALESSAANDSTHTNLENLLVAIGSQRDETIGLLEGAEFYGQTIDQQQALQLINQAENLLNQVATLASH